MRLSRAGVAICVVLLIAVGAISLKGESKNAADYPLRLHIVYLNQMTFYHNRAIDETKGDGRGNLFENSEPNGVDFSFSCPEKVKPSFGFETYPAKWKKQNQELIVLFPVFGKTNAYFTCKLTTQVKDAVYIQRNGRMDTLTRAQYKEWMVKHEYDPEHGKNTPVRLAPRPVGTPEPNAPATPQQ